MKTSVLAAARRRLGALAADPILRRWLLGRALGRVEAVPAFVAGQPPYLPAIPVMVARARDHVTAPTKFVAATDTPPDEPVDLPLPGCRLTLTPGDAETAFAHRCDDSEIDSALHRFAWIPLLGRRINPAWVVLLWQAWCRRFAVPSDDGWAWEAYTVAERLCNILDFGMRHGLDVDSEPDRLEELLRGIDGVRERLRADHRARRSVRDA